MNASSAIDLENENFSWKLFSIISAVHVAAIYGIIFHFKLSNFMLFAGAYFYFMCFGASLGLHRYFSHKSFTINNYFLDVLIHLTSVLCLQGGPVYWATAHRAHHKYSEKTGDPHSATRGFFWAHIGWLFFLKPNGFSYIQSIKFSRDLKQKRLTNFFEKYYMQINFIFLAILLLVSVLSNDYGLFFWIGPIRIVAVWHGTWLVNSYAHSASFFGGTPKIRNSYLLCILSGGDGEHAFHHQRQFSAHHSDKRLSLDYGYGVLKLLSLFGLVSFKKTHSSLDTV